MAVYSLWSVSACGSASHYFPSLSVPSSQTTTAISTTVSAEQTRVVFERLTLLRKHLGAWDQFAFASCMFFPLKAVESFNLSGPSFHSPTANISNPVRYAVILVFESMPGDRAAPNSQIFLWIIFINCMPAVFFVVYGNDSFLIVFLNHNLSPAGRALKSTADKQITFNHCRHFRCT